MYRSRTVGPSAREPPPSRPALRLILLTALLLAVADPIPRGLPERDPAAVGMSAERLATIERVVQRGLSAGGYPGAAVIVGRKGYSVLSRGYGSLDWSGRVPVSTQESLYDLASLTKVVGTTTAVMVLYDQGKIALDAPVARYLPDFTGGLRDQVTIRHLLTHRGGLPAGRELWRHGATPADARAAVLSAPIQCTPGQCYEYSDLGADLLGFVVEAVSRQPIDAFLERQVFSKLGMHDTQYRLDAVDVPRTAPTEIAPPRGYPLRGEVHDENAWALGGVAGHAGLFSTAADLSVFAQMLLDGGRYQGVRVIADSTVALFTRRAAGHRALGWDTCDGGAGCGQYLSAQAFGHTGFTGTSLWIDPERQMFVVLLTNRVHEARARRPSKVIADVRNDLADAAVLAVMDDPAGVQAMPVSFRADLATDWNRPERRARSGRKGRKGTTARGARTAAKATSAAKRKTASTTKTAAKTKTVAKAVTATKAKATSATKAKATSAAKAKTAKTTVSANKRTTGKG